METMKKTIAIILALMMILSLSLTAFAASPTGSITINGVGANTTYEIYRLLDLESYDTSSGAYSYKANSAWAAFFATAEAEAYFATDDAGYVTWVAAEDDDTVAAFAKLALAYAKANSIAPVQSSENPGEFVVTGNTGVFSGLELGYYLVDSTMGALCGLTTTNPDASINAKNGIPTIDKQVKEDSTNQWGDTDTADIAQIVEYRVTINVHAGAENYILHDTMVDGLTFDQVTKIEHVVPGTGTHVTTADKYTVKTGAEMSDTTCDFEVHFTKEFCDSLETNDKIVVYYTAMLNRNAVINGEGNQNTAWLTFGEGGEFKIYDAATGGNEVKVVLKDGGVGYRRARADETGISIVVKNGQIRVDGLDNGTYYLEETVAPAGYNKLTARQKFIISDGNLDAVFNDGVFSTGSGVHVVNKTGTMLPETGGMGTVLFITVGMIVVLGAGVLLVTKKRMSMIQD